MLPGLLLSNTRDSEVMITYANPERNAQRHQCYKEAVDPFFPYGSYDLNSLILKQKYVVSVGMEVFVINALM